MRDEPSVTLHPVWVATDNMSGSAVAEVRHRGFRFLLDFGPGNVTGDGPLRQLTVLPDTQELQPRALRQFAPEAERYVAYARSAFKLFRGDEGTLAERQESYVAAGEALREIAGPGRGHPDSFYRNIAASYQALVDEGEPHPIKAIGEKHHITISGASRWVKEARRRGYIKEADDA